MEKIKENKIDVENNDNIVKVKVKKVFNFKEYYHSNPEFKARHLAKCLTKITCQCGRVYNKAHECKHLRSDIHKRELLKKQIA